MAKFKFQHVEEHQVTSTFTLNFDTSDKQLWSDLLFELWDSEKSKFPSEPPDDADVWFELLSAVSPYTYCEEPDQDFWTARKGGYERSNHLMTPDGDVIRSSE